MKKKQLRFVFGFGIIIAALIFFAISGFQEGKAYYKTIEELAEMGDAAYDKTIKVGGRVSPGSIGRSDGHMIFTLKQSNLTLPVIYTGTAPVPDTFKDDVEAVVVGRFGLEGKFEATQIQAKCASKYEEKYGSRPQNES